MRSAVTLGRSIDVHELSLAQAIADATLRYADGRPVVDVTCGSGYLRQVVPDALQFAWEMLTADSAREGRADSSTYPRSCAVGAAGGPTLDCRSSRAAPAGTEVVLETGDELMLATFDVAEAA